MMHYLRSSLLKRFYCKFHNKLILKFIVSVVLNKDITRNIKQFTKLGMTVLNIGANVGCHTLPMAKLVGLNGKVIALANEIGNRQINKKY